jgi:aerobic carbon-monoxide dehydrogenase large subunit
MSDIGPLYVRRSLLRREDRRLLTGQGQFIADLVLPRMLHAALVRSPAAAAAGARGPNLEPTKWTSVIQHKFLNPQQPLLAHDKLRHVGEAIAIIVAESRK